jgi:hypothetical protein
MKRADFIHQYVLTVVRRDGNSSRRPADETHEQLLGDALRMVEYLEQGGAPFSDTPASLLEKQGPYRTPIDLDRLGDVVSLGLERDESTPAERASWLRGVQAAVESARRYCKKFSPETLGASWGENVARHIEVDLLPRNQALRQCLKCGHIDGKHSKDCPVLVQF